MLRQTVHALVLLLLVTAYPFLSFWVNNLDETSAGDLPRYGALVFACVAAAYLVLVAAFRPRSGRLAAVAAVFVIVLFSFHDVVQACGGDGGVLAIVVWLAALLVCLTLAVWLGGRPTFRRFLLIFALARLALPLASLVGAPLALPGERPAIERAYPLAGNAIWSGRPIRRPDIYWFAFDSYPNARVLREGYGFDNRPQLRFLSRHGFYVAEESYANFNKTKVSVTTALNMEHVFEDGERFVEVRAGMRRWLPGRSRSGLSAAVAGENRTVSFLKQAGYAYVHFDNRFWPVFQCRGFEDVCIHGTRVGLSELQASLLELTPYPALRTALGRGRTDAGQAEPGEQFASGTGIPELGRVLASLERSGPIFVYAHFVAPHPPFQNHADCRLRPAPSIDPDDFTAEVECVNRQMRDLLDRVLDRDPDAIAIVSGDHGPRLLDVNTGWENLAADNVRDRLGILSALRLPEGCREDLWPKIAPVNFMRVVFACLGGHPARLATQKHFLVPENLRSAGASRVRQVDPYAD